MANSKNIILGPAFPLRGGIANFNNALCKAFVAEGIDSQIYSFSLQYPSFFFPGNDHDQQSRWISTEINGIFFCNLYLPNGNPLGTEKFQYKINWMKLLYNYIRELKSLGKPIGSNPPGKAVDAAITSPNLISSNISL